MGSAVRRSRMTKPTPAPTGGQQAEIAGETQPSLLPKVTATMRPTTAGKNSPRPAQSKGTLPTRCRLRGMNRIPATIPMSPAGTLTKKTRRQPPAASSRPPTAGPSARPSAWAAPWMPMLRPSDLRGHSQIDDGHAVGLQHGRAHGLESPEGVERSEAGREAAQDRTHDEDAEAIGVEQFAPDHVGEAAHGGDRGHQHQQVAEADPSDRRYVGMKDVLQRGQGHGDDAGVELPHEGADAHGRHHEPGGATVPPPSEAGAVRRAVAATRERVPDSPAERRLPLPLAEDLHSSSPSHSSSDLQFHKSNTGVS